MFFNTIVFPPFLIAFLVTLIATPICVFFLKKFGIVDDPKTHKHPAILHSKPIPRGGGIPLFLAYYIQFSFFRYQSFALFAVFCLFCWCLDDKYDLSPIFTLLPTL
jgi:UDP-N-acetylmuramyl pentapeptide phosphotransferase/UDP-N-acetylglucosamine-1-phosphate transferase